MASRKIEDLTPETQAAFRKFEQGMKAAEVDFLVTCTLRTQKEQNALYAQGRSKPGKIVTKTFKSKHILGIAFDIVIMHHGKPTWDIHDSGWAIAGRIGRESGLFWGGDWLEFKDYPHFELPVAKKES